MWGDWEGGADADIYAAPIGSEVVLLNTNPSQVSSSVTDSRTISGVSREDFEEAHGTSEHDPECELREGNGRCRCRWRKLEPVDALGCATNTVVDHEDGSVSGEQHAFEEWLSEIYPSGDAESVHRQWKESSNYEDWFSSFNQGTAKPETPIWVELRNKIDAVLRDHTWDAYTCGRTWAAWSVGTMGEDDFTKFDSGDRIEKLVYDLEAVYELEIVKLRAALSESRAEVERLTGCLKRANEGFQKYERLWYLQGDELTALREENARFREWRPITDKTHRKMILAVAINPPGVKGRYTTDPWAIWWDEKSDEWVRWPHAFHPTHYSEIPTAPVEAEKEEEGV